MTVVAVVICTLVTALGALGVVSPDRLLDIARRFETPVGVYVAAGLRLLLGAALIVSAPTARVSDAVRVLGLIIFVAGLVTPWFGLERLKRVTQWWATRSPLFQRAWSGLALILGLFLTYAVLPQAAE